MQKSIHISTYEEYEILERELEDYIGNYTVGNLHLVMYSIREAVNNAFEHGIKRDSTFDITVSAEINGSEIIIEVEHNGDGFNHEEKIMSVKDTDQYFIESLLSTRGRGIAIMKKCAKHISYSEGGRKLTLLFGLEK
ncbi:ATP-binding protein [Robertmurraya korlensis]|uniref:ATP-binding protein n=1 Tax=Robertmurraya korlensis TaxID=519977 RepID=UPI00203C5952|nr:ATP-binding protein [Robertmurraya korlensis]MCM3600004.1 ATP-binding protein [Robertmurraya korlensis]